jgi:hypothetical protein
MPASAKLEAERELEPARAYLPPRATGKAETGLPAECTSKSELANDATPVDTGIAARKAYSRAR